MQSKFGFVALGVMATFLLFGGTTVEAKSQSTDTKEAKRVYVKIEPGDSLTAIAENNDTSYIRIFNANKSIDNPDLIYPGDRLRIPHEDEKLKNRFASLSDNQQTAMVAAVSYSQPSAGSAPRGSSAGNTYVNGSCTWYAKEMRPDLPNMLGNGGQWVSNAAAQGIPTGSTPSAGAIAEEPGHVAYVESVSKDKKSITISEMGYAGNSGVNRRTVPASNYRYIY